MAGRSAGLCEAAPAGRGKLRQMYGRRISTYPVRWRVDTLAMCLKKESRACSRDDYGRKLCDRGVESGASVQCLRTDSTGGGLRWRWWRRERQWSRFSAACPVGPFLYPFPEQHRSKRRYGQWTGHFETHRGEVGRNNCARRLCTSTVFKRRDLESRSAVRRSGFYWALSARQFRASADDQSAVRTLIC